MRRPPLFALLLFVACKSSSPENVARDRATAAPSAPAPRPATSAAGPTRGDRNDLLGELPNCEIEHFGRLLDFGTAALAPWSRFRVQRETATVTRDSATHLEVTSRELGYDFWLEEPLDKLKLSLRGRAGAARRVQAVFDGKRGIAARLPEGETRAIELPEINGPFPAGLHRLSLSFGGAPRGASVLQAELDWLRIVTPGPRDAMLGYAAPTLDDVVEDVALAGTPRRSIVLRAPSTVRCFVRPVPDMRLRVALGFWGPGQGTAEIVARPEGGEPVVLEKRRLTGGDSAVWTPVELDLGRLALEPVALELRATEATRGGRVAFGDPELLRRTSAPPEPALARVVVLVVLSAIDRRRVPPWGPGGGLPALSELAREGAAFSRYRAPTSVPPAVLATLLTGLSPRVHTLEAPLLSLPATLRTLPRLTKEASGSAAMFTSNPATFAPFGFNVGWDAFEAFSPVKDIAASEPFARAAVWVGRALDERPEARHLVVIHARGAHPPWDVTREEALQLKPSEYGGALEPRRGGMILGSLRRRGARAGKRLLDSDWERLRALGDAALAKQDAGLVELTLALKQRNSWDSALIVVMGDVGPGTPPEIPFDPAGPLSEERLAVPLLVKFPGRAFAGREIQTPVTAADVAATLYAALGLRAPEGVPGVDLGLRANGRGELDGDVQHATLFGRYATRLGSWLLSGELGQTPRLCALDMDPACSADLLGERSIAARTAWLATLAAESAELPAELGSAVRTSVELDPGTRAALTVWGDVPE